MTNLSLLYKITNYFNHLERIRKIIDDIDMELLAVNTQDEREYACCYYFHMKIDLILFNIIVI